MPYSECEDCGTEYPLGTREDYLMSCQLCGAWTCKCCRTGDGEDLMCKYCAETLCEKCGGEGGQVMIGDEYIWKCGYCGYIDGSR